MTTARRPRLLSKRFAIPVAHGSWVWWLGPLLVGLAAGGHPRWTFLSLALSAFAGFLVLQPSSIAVKVLAGRRPRAELKPALIWLGIYALSAALGVACIVQTGHAHVLGLAAPALPLFTLHLWLVYRHAERRQRLVEMLGAGVLALTAPAAYWVAGGTDYPQPWALWAMTWLQSAAGIANVYVRLEQRLWKASPPTPARLRAGVPTLLHHGAGLVAASLFVVLDLAPPGVLAAFAFVSLDAVDTALRPLPGVRPSRIGMRQLVVTILFVALMMAAYVI